MQIKYTDALIIGGGLAGLRSAIATGAKGLDTIVISLVPVKRSHSAAAQGGMQSSLGNAIMGEGDNEDVHFGDTVKGSDWGCDQEVARMFVNTAPKAIRELAAWGVPWSRIEKGNREVVINTKKTIITEKDEAHGLINARDFGGTKKWRTCYTADATGHTMLYAVANEALRLGVVIEDKKEAISLIMKDEQCYGAIVRDLKNGGLTAYVAKGTMIATGGYGRIYKQSTNATICKGTGHAIAINAGAYMGNMEAIQFHPTPIVPSGILLTEGCRGDGGVLRDKDGYRFMPDYEPEKMDLASRDVVSRRILEHIKKGKGVPSPYGEHLWLDISILGRAHIEKNLRDVQDISHTFNGIDPADEGEKGWMPILPMQHYSMGGIRTTPKGESVNIKGLFSSGEAACWDMHGFNRLGGNSVSEAVVAGMIVGNYFADFCKNVEIKLCIDSVQKEIDKQNRYLDDLLKLDGDENIYDIKDKMRLIMQEKVGIFRNGKDLTDAVEELKVLLKKTENISITKKHRLLNQELEEAYKVPMMLKVALCVAKGARDRTESRGAHYREDYLKRDDENWLNRTISYWENEDDLEPTLKYEELDIMKMEIPPAFRGYGRKGMILENPLSQKRQDEVDRITAEYQGDRYELQERLMPYELQPEYKSKNQRIGDEDE
ncbi:fumarate reductase flavoprotein subunit [Sulfurovum sp. bin170]|uniref:fumarate reductase flavoprotein subunit n=1 Tax=Sulfurovum sp. bin170 TaxID=2695268 RepID=UPI0013E0BC26|nr:fumarate reductase flavoprotein subunit [Sulfurovum sp. bin170]NEW61536.1 fumarate reductase flavoprotein subunit [Sulfurovum sp. bin170]